MVTENIFLSIMLKAGAFANFFIAMVHGVYTYQIYCVREDEHIPNG